MTVLIRIALLATLALSLPGALQAKPWWLRGADNNESDFLPPDAAFRVSSAIDGNLVRVHWAIAEGYYLYRKRMEILAESPDLELSTPVFPAGTPKNDPWLGTQEIYTQDVEGTAAFTRSDFGAHPMQIKVTYQGCAEAGLCYPPITKVMYPASPVPPAVHGPAHSFEGTAILGGAAAFFLAGLLLRKGRRLDLPA